MSLSASNSDNSTKNLISQVLASSPQVVPNQDQLSGKELKQVQQTRQNQDDLNMQSDAAIAGTQGKDRAKSTENIENLEQQGVAATPRSNSEPAATTLSATQQKNLEAAQAALAASSLSSLSSVSAEQAQEIKELVASALTTTSSSGLETPALPQPKVTPRQDVSEIGLALARAIAALGEATLSAISDYQSTQQQSQIMGRASLESQGLKIDSERKEFQKMQELESKSGSNKALDIASKVMMAISIAITVISVVAAIFTCGIGLIGTAAAGATAAAAGTTAGVAAGVSAGVSAATSSITATISQVTIQAVIQAVKQAIVTAVKQAIQQAIKMAIKQGIKKAIKAAIKAAVKTLVKNIGKIFKTGKAIIQKAFPKLTKVLDTLGSKWVMMGLSAAIAVPSLVQGITSLQMADIQKELAEIQRETGMLSAQAEIMNLFTKFWMEASKIAAKNVSSASEMQDQASKLGAQIAKAFSSISAGFAAAV